MVIKILECEKTRDLFAINTEYRTEIALKVRRKYNKNITYSISMYDMVLDIFEISKKITNFNFAWKFSL